ncbi:energy-coupling factor transporter transmembrane protein EcfT, partial [Paenibacillus sepulcri]|nr:energy-coupling factor transporter transmembrane protein EcfT [Paenibacillus sepulcri]
EQLFAWAGRVPPWAQRLILTITLLLRFVPILLEEWERFSRIAVARGKAPRVTILGAVGQLRDTAIPFMLALFRLGEHAADALESRGIGTRQPTFIRSQFWKRRDTYLLIGCLLIFGFFWIWAKGLFNFM